VTSPPEHLPLVSQAWVHAVILPKMLALPNRMLYLRTLTSLFRNWNPRMRS